MPEGSSRRARSFLFAMFEGGGNVPLILPIVGCLAARGHQVTVLAGPNLRRPGATAASDALLERVVATGASVLRLAEPWEHPLDGFAPRGLVFGRAPRRLFKASDLARTARWAQAWAEGVRARIEIAAPDAVVADYFLLGALAAGEHAQLPTAALVHTATLPWPLPGLPPPGTGFALARNPLDRLRDRAWGSAYRRVARRDGLDGLNRARAALALQPVDSPYRQYERATRVLVLGSKAFDFPARHLPENVRYVGTPFEQAAPGEWRSPWASDDPRPLVLVSLSTLPQGQGPLMQRILNAVGQLPLRVIVTVGPSLDRSRLDAPTNAHLETFLSHDAVLPHVDAVITQCGFGTLTKALAHGVPVLCIPLIGDQPDNAARAVALGVGVRLRPDAAEAAIGAAVNRLLNETGLAEAARKLAVAMQSQDGAEVAATELETL